MIRDSRRARVVEQSLHGDGPGERIGDACFRPLQAALVAVTIIALGLLLADHLRTRLEALESVVQLVGA